MKKVAVKIVGRVEGAALIQWPDGEDYKRAFVPPETLQEGQVDETVLEAAIPYGVPWEDFLDIKALTPKRIAREMRRIGIWTIDDLRAKGPIAKQAVWGAIQFDLGALIRAVEEEA